MDKTEFFDRSGKPIYIGDIVQYRLSKNIGPQLCEVVRRKKRVCLSNGIPLQKQYEQYISIVDTSSRKTDPEI